MISAVIDRFEGDKAVLLLGDEEKQVNFPAKFLPEEVTEGDYIKIDIAYDEEATKAAEEEAEALLKKLEDRP